MNTREGLKSPSLFYSYIIIIDNNVNNRGDYNDSFRYKKNCSR